MYFVYAIYFLIVCILGFIVINLSLMMINSIHRFFKKSKSYPKPDDLYLDGEYIRVVDPENEHIPTPYVMVGERINLSPYEADELLEWLQKFLDYQKAWRRNGKS